MQKVLKTVDCVVEVHDARIPFTGRNPLLRDRISAIKPLVVTLNKADLISKEDADEIKRRFKRKDFREEVEMAAASVSSGGVTTTIVDVPSPPAAGLGGGETEFVFMGMDTAEKVRKSFS